ncbi:MAG: hypothetical protein H6Q48_3609, partial [Deltaproteobacteria bacterium]|nr:hypothetical protein [Deltaproteobacteria bacterium]
TQSMTVVIGLPIAIEVRFISL